MARFVDGFVVPVKKKKYKDYVKMAKKAGKLWKEYGALEYVECVADDVHQGKVTSFPRSVKLKKDEIVVFAYIVYKSRKHRDSLLKKIMQDERLKKMCTPGKAPFDPMRMFWGGFKTIVEA